VICKFSECRIRIRVRIRFKVVVRIEIYTVRMRFLKNCADWQIVHNKVTKLLNYGTTLTPLKCYSWD